MTAISLDTIGSTLASRLLVSAALLASCEAHYPGTLFSVFYGATGDVAPDNQDFPTFAIFPTSKRIPVMADKKWYSLSIAIEIEQANPTITEVDDVPTLTDYSGAAILEEFADIVLDEVKAMSNSLSIEEATLDVETLAFFPVATAVLTVTVTIPTILGGGSINL